MNDLAGRFNLRDIGGAGTTDGQRVRTGLVFRSASVADMTTDDLVQLNDLGIQLVVDLRSTAERQRAPSRHAIRTWAGEATRSRADLTTVWTPAGLTPERATALMIDVYRGLPEEQAAAYAELFRRIADGALPVLFHCAAGKDRTGVGAALLLDLLGVPRAAVLKDYLRTRQTATRAIAEARKAMAALGMDGSDDAALEPILSVDDAYLAAMFAAVEQQYGSVRRYVTDRLDLSAAEIDSIRAALLEAGPVPKPA